MARGRLSATVILQDVDGADSIPERTVTLTEPHWRIKIGRGTMSGDEDLRPAEDNTWFDSRVMSRNHAILRADPVTRGFSIEDVGSMHGTHCNGRRLKSNTPEVLYNRDTLVFGADVTRGSSHFRALKVMVVPFWSDREAPDSIHFASTYRNTFSADYSEEDMYDDPADDDAIYDELPGTPFHGDRHAKTYNDQEDWAEYSEDESVEDPDNEVEIVKESIRAPSVEVVIPPRGFSVPDSEISDASSYFSDGEVAESPTSSPLQPSDEGKKNSDNDNARSPVVTRVDLDEVESAADATETLDQLMSPSRQEAEVIYSEPDDEDGSSIEDNQASDDHFISADSCIRSDGIGSRLKNTLSVQAFSSEAARAPSPSDAAMVKPSSDYLMAPPFVQSSPHYNGEASTLDHVGHESAWAGHNSILYDPVPRQTSVAQNAYSTVYAPYGTSFPMNGPSLNYPPILSSSSYPLTIPNAPPPLQPPELKPASKFSIDQLVDQLKKDAKQANADRSMPLKRKADQISSSPECNSHDNVSSSLAAGAETESTKIENNRLDTTLQSIAKPGPAIIVESAPSSAADDAEAPPPKKAKKNNHRGNEGASFMKMAAATIAGMAIGTVGTIIGLASLPQDYFL